MSSFFTKTNSFCSSSNKEVKLTFNPDDIFHNVDIVGLDSPLSICPNIALLTPVNFDASSKLKPKLFLNLLRFCPTFGSCDIINKSPRFLNL